MREFVDAVSRLLDVAEAMEFAYGTNFYSLERNEREDLLLIISGLKACTDVSNVLRDVVDGIFDLALLEGVSIEDSGGRVCLAPGETPFYDNGQIKPLQDLSFEPCPGDAGSAAAPPRILGVDTFREDQLVYFRLSFDDPNGDAVGFGFRGINGSGWAEESHPFSSPSYGRVAPGQIEYPFNHGCGTSSEYASQVEAWIYDFTNLRSESVVISLHCGTASSYNGAK